jgi:hypothetical protein
LIVDVESARRNFDDLYTSERLDVDLVLPFTYSEFEKRVRGLYNTLGNLYRIPLDYVLRTTKP